MTIKSYVLKATADSSGDGTATTPGIVKGKLVSVRVNYPAATATVDLDTVGFPITQKLMDLAAANTDATYYPMVDLVDETGAAVEYASGYPIRGQFVIDDYIKLTIASGTSTQEVSVMVTVDE